MIRYMMVINMIKKTSRLVYLLLVLTLILTVGLHLDKTSVNEVKDVILDVTSSDDTVNKTTNNTTSDENRLDKSKPIYFAMDHVNTDDEEIRDNIVSKLESKGFNVVKAEIGPSTLSGNTHYLYDNNISGAIVFHLFNGVDPSTIRELAKNGDDNIGRAVRANDNDVVLAWFYDSSDCVHEGGTSYKQVPGSETGSSLSNPREYMDENDIHYICTSSDMHRRGHGDYNGDEVVAEFLKLFE